MIDDSCQVLISSDDPPKVLKSEDDKILIECENCCDRDITEINNIDVTLAIDAVFNDVACGDPASVSNTFTWNFVRISKDDTIDCFTPGLYQFQLFMGPVGEDGCCTLAFLDKATHCSSGVYSVNWGVVGVLASSGDFRFPTFNCTFDETCNTGTVTLTFDNDADTARFIVEMNRDINNTINVQYNRIARYTEFSAYGVKVRII